MRARSTCSIPLKVLHTDFWSTSECQRPVAHKQRHVVMKVACAWPARSITVATSCNNVARCCVEMLRAFGQAFKLPKAWFLYRCICRICRVCRTKKIHRTDRIHSSRTTSCICRFFCIEHLYGRFP